MSTSCVAWLSLELGPINKELKRLNEWIIPCIYSYAAVCTLEYLDGVKAESKLYFCL